MKLNESVVWVVRRVAVTTGVLAAAVGLVACGNSSAARSSEVSASTSSAPGPATSDAVTIRNFKFSPTPLTVRAGATLTVKNLDGTDHTLTADDHSFDTGRFSAGSKTIQLPKPGRFTFHCDVHNFMTGVINVTA